MAKYTVVAAVSVGQIEVQGNPLNKVMVTMTDEAGNQVGAEMLQKPDTALPAAGSTLEGTIEETKYGKRFKKDRQAGGFGGGARGRSPEERDEIMRQNALTNAVAYVTAKASLMDKKAGQEYMNGKQVIQVATFFHKYSKGQVTVVNQDEQPNEDGETPPTEPEVTDTPAPAVPEEVNIDDIPFT